MPSLVDLILNSRSRTPTARVYLGSPQRGIPPQPVQVPNVSGAITLSQTFGQPIAGGTVQLRNPPFTPWIKDTIFVEWGYNGLHLPAITGFVTDPNHKSYPNSWTVQVKDILWLADFAAPSNTPITFDPPNNLTGTEVLLRLLRDWAGIPGSRIALPELEQSPGVPWLLGTLTPITFQGSPLQACRQICDVLGLWLFADPAGVVRAVQMSGAPTAQPFRAIRDGRDHLVNSPPEITGSADAIYSKVTVTGANTGVLNAQVKDSRQLEHPLLPGGKYRELTFHSALVEYVNEEQAGAASCTGVARRLLAEHSRSPEAVRGRIKADPRLQVGMTADFQCARLGYETARPFFVYSLQTTWGGGDFSQQYVLDGGVGSDGYTTIPPPLAAFTFELHAETLVDGATVEVFVNGSASRSLGGGEIVAWAWHDDSTPQQTGSGVRMVFRYPAGQVQAVITLTVTDTNSKTNTIQQTIPLAGDVRGAPTRRVISIAGGSAWYVTENSGELFRVERGGQDAIAVPPISAAGSSQADTAVAEEVGLITTGGSGGSAIRQTLDFLATASSTLGTLVGPVRALWQHEKNARLIIGAVGDAVYRSLDGGSSWSLAGRPATGQNVNVVLVSIDNESIIDALAGHRLLTSFDAGATWSEQLVGPEGATARCYALGFARRWVGFVDCEPGASPLRSAEGDVAAFPEVTPPVTGIRALTMLVEEPVLIAVDDSGRIWHLSAEDGGNAVHTTTLPEV